MVNVALAQIEINDDIYKNVDKILKFIEKAASKKADIICFPESTLGDTILNINSDNIGLIKCKCKEKKIYCIIGAHIKHSGKVYNSAILINRKGKVQYVYRKNNLFFGLELKETCPGKGNKIINVDFGKIGIIICWDFAFPQMVKKLSEKGAQIVFCPSYLLNDAQITKEVFRGIPLVRAFENNVYFILCDAFGEEVLGESYICSPLEVLNKVQNREGIIFSEINLQYLSDLKDSFSK